MEIASGRIDMLSWINGGRNGVRAPTTRRRARVLDRRPRHPVGPHLLVSGAEHPRVQVGLADVIELGGVDVAALCSGDADRCEPLTQQARVCVRGWDDVLLPLDGQRQGVVEEFIKIPKLGHGLRRHRVIDLDRDALPHELQLERLEICRLAARALEVPDASATRVS
jgi:hypothetical protein